jgi:hypothetical protein
MKTLLPITHIVSRNCGGQGAWLDNSLNSPAPSSEIWKGFQMGGSSKRRRVTRYRRKHKRIYHTLKGQKSRKHTKHSKHTKHTKHTKR